MTARLPGTAALVAATALGTLLATSPAFAQEDYGAMSYREAPGEEVIVTAPRYHPHYPADVSGHFPEATTLSTNVRYDDLDLTTRHGARELRMRVRDAAAEVCGALAQRYPVKMSDGKSCYRNAAGGGLNRASQAIREARYEAGY